jgi:K+-transporting ATPase KdpF subunit
MAFGRGSLFRTLGRSGPTLQQPEGRRVTVDWTTILALLVTIVLVGYLTIALLLPEKFS